MLMLISKSFKSYLSLNLEIKKKTDTLLLYLSVMLYGLEATSHNVKAINYLEAESIERD